MEESRPWRYDPVAFGYFAMLEAHLRRQGTRATKVSGALSLTEDLLVRSREAAEKSKAGDNSLATTLKRVAWCCYTACDALLASLTLPVPDEPADRRTAIDARRLEAMDNAIKGIQEAANIQCAEYRMDGTQDLRGSAQTYGDELKKRLRVLHALRKMLAAAKAYCEQNNKDAAMDIGDLFVVFLVEQGKTRDGLVAVAEQLVEVHGG